MSIWPIPLAPLTAAVRTLNVPNVSSSSLELALAALCIMRAAFLSVRFPRRFFRANALRLSLSSRCFLPRFLPSFFRRVGCSIPTRNTPRLLHRRHFCLLACALRTSLLSSLRVPRFPRRRCTKARLPRKTISLCWAASPPVDAVSRLALSASTRFSHISTRLNCLRLAVFGQVRKRKTKLTILPGYHGLHPYPKPRKKYNIPFTTATLFFSSK